MGEVLNDGWFDLSLTEQMMNIGLEVKRAFRFDNDLARRNAFLDNAIKATELTVKDPKNAMVVPELNICIEVLKDYKGERFLDTSKEQILNYYSYFFELLQSRPAGHRAALPKQTCCRKSAKSQDFASAREMAGRNLTAEDSSEV